MKRLLLSLAVAAPLLLSACGSGEEQEAAAPAPAVTTAAAPSSPAATTTPTATTPPAAAPALDSGLPELDVVRVGSGGQQVPLTSLAVAGKPTLVWAWAPHCVFCRQEAPDVVAFQQAHGTEVTVVGLGAQDDAEQAEDFVTETGTQSIPMVWDRTGRSWIDLDITNQPTVVLLDADGEVQKTWFRDFDADEILKAARA